VKVATPLECRPIRWFSIQERKEKMHRCKCKGPEPQDLSLESSSLRGYWTLAKSAITHSLSTPSTGNS
jgi:hypothetical protein